MIIAKTPYRLSFFGGGTDYPQWFENHGGMVISTTIDKYVYLTVRPLPPFFEHKHRIVWSRIENVMSFDEIQHPSVRECLKYFNVKDGIEIHYDGDLPARSGIGSSSSFTVGLLQVLHALRGDPVTDKIKLGEEAIYIEQKLIGEHVGNQDQIAAAVGGFNCIEFLPKKVNVIPMTGKCISQLEACLLLVFTGFPHMANEVAATYEFDNKEAELVEIDNIAQRAKHVINNDGCVMELGRLLHESWLLKKRLSDRITTPYIDYVYGKACQSGAIGGKMCGAGGGGFMMLFAEPDKHAQIKKALEGLLFVPLKFENKGSQIIVNNGA